VTAEAVHGMIMSNVPGILASVRALF